MNSLFRLAKSSRGELKLVIDTGGVARSVKQVELRLTAGFVNRLTYLFQVLDKLTGNQALLMLVMALGLGFGIGLVVFQQPTAIRAQPISNKSTHATANIAVIQTEASLLTIKEADSLNYLWPLPTQTNHYRYSANPGENGPILIYVAKHHQKLLEQARLGQSILVTTTAQGLYHYTVTEIRQIDIAQFNALLPSDQELLVLYSRSKLWPPEFFLIMARPS